MKFTQNVLQKLTGMINTLREDFENQEFEVVFNNKYASRYGRIDQNSFENVIRRLKALGHEFKQEKKEEVLDIEPKISHKFRKSRNKKNTRISITGINNIKRYCSTNNIKGLDNITFTEKTPRDSHRIGDYNLKFNLKEEITKPINNIDKSILFNWETSKKYFRYKKRFSFSNEKFRIDLTIVKSSSNKNGTNTFLESDVLNNAPKYEIEIEFIGNNNSYDESSFNNSLTLKSQNLIMLDLV